MIHSPETAKPVLHLPQLEANWFNQLQTRNRRPGDHFNQSGDIIHGEEEFLYHAPASIGSRGSPLTPTCLIWNLLHSNSNSSFSLSLCTTSEPSKPYRRSQGSSLIH
ncbi:hypothetical protein DY000_02061267 [Brassica cretica]|uniref:Uncharacterized protein n=1 Tax=Brassica cretica TaxID=69181 RepID=A0ABQ7ASX6_BRACR|nr:hypothetical protein DY000_02061267 [Brassica cretica]